MNLITLIKRFPLVTFFMIAYATSFVGGYLSERYPSDWWALFVYGPFIGAFIVIAASKGREGLKEWFSRIVRWRVGFRWYLVALLLPIVLQVIAFGINRLLGAAMPTASQLGTWPDFIPEFIFILLFLGLAEEPGFRGFALQHLLTGRSALVASLILGVLHTIWHLPLFVSGSEPLTIIPIILSGAILLSWLYLHTNGSVLLTMLMHASVNTAAGFFSALFLGVEVARHTIVLAVVYVATALIIVAVAGPNLRQKSVE